MVIIIMHYLVNNGTILSFLSNAKSEIHRYLYKQLKSFLFILHMTTKLEADFERLTIATHCNKGI